MTFAHDHDRVVEWGDCDPAGIVFYPRFFSMFDAATAFLMEAATGRRRVDIIEACSVVSWPMVDTRAVFHVPVRYDDRIVIKSRVTRLGRSSFDVLHQLVRDAVVCVEANEVRVWSARDPETGRIAPKPLPGWLRASLQP